MRFTVMYPIAQAGYGDAYLEPATVIAFAQAAEAAGFDAIAFTEHPAPSRKWLERGGHHSFDPLAALAFCAGVTSTIRLMTFLLVVPYRNPFLSAKGIATVDVLSGGRTIVGTGAGYLRSEFAALGVPFEERNELYDEAVEAMLAAWGEDGYSGKGRHFEAIDQLSRPRPVQQPHPPLWFGGNSRRSLERVARWGQGWCPMVADDGLASSTRTTAMTNDSDFSTRLEQLHVMLDAAGRDRASVDVQLLSPEREQLAAANGSHAAHVERLAHLADLGVGWFVLDAPTDPALALDALARYGDEVIAAFRP